MACRVCCAYAHRRASTGFTDIHLAGGQSHQRGSHQKVTRDTHYAWLSLASPTGDVTFRQIHASDSDVIAFALSVDEGQKYAYVPEAMGGVNSNSAAAAVAHAADGGYALVSGGAIEPGASVASRVGLNSQCVAP